MLNVLVVEDLESNAISSSDVVGLGALAWRRALVASQIVTVGC